MSSFYSAWCARDHLNVGTFVDVVPDCVERYPSRNVELHRARRCPLMGTSQPLSHLRELLQFQGFQLRQGGTIGSPNSRLWEFLSAITHIPGKPTGAHTHGPRAQRQCNAIRTPRERPFPHLAGKRTPPTQGATAGNSTSRANIGNDAEAESV